MKNSNLSTITHMPFLYVSMSMNANVKKHVAEVDPERWLTPESRRGRRAVGAFGLGCRNPKEHDKGPGGRASVGGRIPIAK